MTGSIHTSYFHERKRRDMRPHGRLCQWSPRQLGPRNRPRQQEREYRYSSQRQYTIPPLINIRLIIPSIHSVRKRIRAEADGKTCKSMKNCHNTLNMIPCNPFAIHFVTKPLPNNPDQPSTAITALAASMYPMRVSFTWR